MINTMKYGIIGGDCRFRYLQKLLDGKCLTALLSETSRDGVNTTVDNVIAECDNIILPIPLTRDGMALTAPHFPSEPLFLDELLPKLRHKPVFAGAVSEDILSQYPNITDYSAPERFQYENARLTAEGTLSEIIRLYSGSVYGAGILISGYGRIGSQLAAMCFMLGADVTVAARRVNARYLAVQNGYHAIDTANLNLVGYDIIVNTVPSVIMTENVLKTADNAIIFELASPPYGADYAAAKALNIPYYILPGLPSKYCAKTAARLIYDEIMLHDNADTND